MRIKIYATEDWTKFDLELIQLATEWAIPRLGLDCVDDLIEISLKDIPWNLTYGDCVYEIYDDTHTLNIYKKKHFLSTLFHEMCHVAQYANDELELVNQGAYWKGAFIPKPRKNEDWYNSPWEREARDVEKTLLAEFTQEILNHA